jgi:hypothetical protein
MLNEETIQLKRTKMKDEKDYSLKFEELSSNYTELKVILNQHNKVMNDIKPLLKTINKVSADLECGLQRKYAQQIQRTKKSFDFLVW